MYISINRKAGRFVHKHDSLRTVCDLDFIQGGAHDVFPIESSGFVRDYTQDDLQRLYRNTTGGDNSPYQGDALRNVLAELATRFPSTDANSFEADRQAHWIETFASWRSSDEDGSFQYVRGAGKPAKASAQLEPPALVTLTREEAATAAVRKRVPPAPVHEPVVTAATPVTTPAPRVRVVTGGLRVGKTRTTIWEVADKMWGDAGSPNDKPTVLALRKKIMEALEQMGIKRSTSSNELGAWQRNKGII